MLVGLAKRFETQWSQFSMISTDFLCLRVAQMPKSPDVVIFHDIYAKNTIDCFIFTPCACMRGNNLWSKPQQSIWMIPCLKQLSRRVYTTMCPVFPFMMATFHVPPYILLVYKKARCFCRQYWKAEEGMGASKWYSTLQGSNNGFFWQSKSLIKFVYFYSSVPRIQWASNPTSFLSLWYSPPPINVYFMYFNVKTQNSWHIMLRYICTTNHTMR